MRDAFLFVFGMLIFVAFVYTLVYSVMWDPLGLLQMSVGFAGCALFLRLFPLEHTHREEHKEDEEWI